MNNLQSSAFVAKTTQLLSSVARLRLLLVMLLTLSVSAAWGATDVTVKWTASSGGLGSGIGSGTIKTGTFSWNYTRTLKSGSSYTGWTENCIQLGKNGGVENITFTTSAIPGKIKSVSVECSSYNNAHKVSIKVGNTTYLSSTATPKWTTVSAKTGSGTSSGQIVISFTDGSRALYIKSISVTYEEAATCTTPPTVSAGSNSNVTSTTATVSCTGGITSLGSTGCSITSYGFVYGTSTNPTISNTKVQIGTTYTTIKTAFSKGLTGLTANTTYYVRPYATNGNGTAYGTQTSFKTLELPKYTVTLKDDNSTRTQQSAGGSVDLPSRDGCEGYTFAGWTKTWTEEQDEWTTTAPEIISAGDYTPTANENLYPVYTKTEGGGTSYQFQQVTALSQIKAGGTFIITNGSYYLPNAQASSSGPTKANMVEVTNGVVTGTVTDAMKWTFSAADANGKITIKSAANSNHYLYTISDNNGLRVNTTSDTWTFEEYTVSNILGFAMKSTSNSRYCAVYTNGSNWRSYTTKNAGNYGTNSGRLDLYKSTEVSSSTTSYISVPDCATETVLSMRPQPAYRHSVKNLLFL